VLYPIWRRCLLATPVILSILSSAVAVQARPADVFIPHLEMIQQNLPPGLGMRLPTTIPLSGPSDIEESKLIVRVFPSESPQSFTVSLFTCARGSHPCLLASFAVESDQAINAKLELERHRSLGNTVFLGNNIQGYVIDGPRQKSSYAFSTLMWQQKGMIYTISFPASERENLILMAASMSREQPLYPR
jgi:hypothetical protein